MCYDLIKTGSYTGLIVLYINRKTAKLLPKYTESRQNKRTIPDWVQPGIAHSTGKPLFKPAD
jgi:hypothetical protein